MKKMLWLICPLLIGINSCTKENPNDSDFVVGDIFTDSNIRVILIDTMTVESSTMKYDSVPTSQSSRILVGKYTDSIFGTVKSSSYMELVPSKYSIDTEAEYDSIAFYLKFDNYYYNDTLQNNTIHVKQLSENLKPNDDSGFYNTSEASFFEDDLGSMSYKPRPLDTDSLEIKLTDVFGRELFKQFQDKSIVHLDEFKAFFKGISLQPDEGDNGSIIGFSKTSASSFIRLYFSTSEENDRVQNYIDFYIDSGSSPIPFFNQVTAQEPNEYLKFLTDKEINLNSSDSENMSFIQSGIGIATRIEFPFVKSIYEIQGEGTILDAVLKIRPVSTTYDNHVILRDTLSVFLADENNDLTKQLFISDIEPVRAILNRDNQEFNDIFYELPLGSYIDQLLLAERDTKEALVLLPDNYNSTVDRFVLNGNNNSNDLVTLQITYAIYDEDEN
ncbi:DUF4270 family protein [Maribacter sp. HTCC2170]|uniref:DUF4270 family protein n=1 Tax=Maribacter sp. (strain HTCC2170 / KCCM 42371) TaxID=313603 RepID=UPI00006B47D0|nr:DUF4270 family protein [Maribacter sp. HTCC2170]EAR01902.1 hypothetical protein FB2170_15278 [Maribacter sp. HTCC2170]